MKDARESGRLKLCGIVHNIVLLVGVFHGYANWFVVKVRLARSLVFACLCDKGPLTKLIIHLLPSVVESVD